MGAPSIIKAGNTLTVHFLGKKIFAVTDSVKNWKKILETIKAKDWDELLLQLDLTQAVATKSKGRAEIIKDQVFLDGRPVKNAVSERILEMVMDDWDFNPLLRFLENSYANPAPWAVNELFLFLETNKLPITEDGCFLAYKVVNHDYTDCYTSKIDNSIGQVVTMERQSVDAVRDRTCSYGLHFCSYEYIKSFSSWYNDKKPRLMLVKINPVDVVSIPSDYSNTKGRCCKYEVIDEVDINTRESHNASAPPVVDLRPLEGPTGKPTPAPAGPVLNIDMIIDMLVEEMKNAHLDTSINPSFSFNYYGDSIDLEEILTALDLKLETELAGADWPEDIEDRSLDTLAEWILEQKLAGPVDIKKGDVSEDDYSFEGLCKHFNVSKNASGTALKGLREGLSITGQALADKLDRSRSSVWSFENSLNPKQETIHAVLTALRDLEKAEE
jgi:acyl carrier protein/predicted DNA-binding protein YlxM (UPF0122 family)